MNEQKPLDDVGGARELARYRLDVAKEDLAAAELSMSQQQYRSANNRAYYAIFHAISACLALEFKAFKHHAQVIGHFNKDFVHTGKFPADIAGKIKEAQNLREACDYADFYIVSIADTETQLKTAHEIVGLVEQYLQSKQDEK